LHLQVQAAVGLGYFSTSQAIDLGVAEKHVPKVTAELALDQAWETVLLLVLWGWCLWRMVAGKDWGEPAFVGRVESSRPDILVPSPLGGEG
ncbi:MAG TPA: hypothetical protein VFG68_00565, partial [Fimbriiglobus sp.]|nr:hypothetical protein [Fimbriiglobus sp.]